MCRHLQSASHLKAERACDETRGGVGQYVVAGELKAAKVIRTETIWAHFVAKDNLPFTKSDTFPKMASHMFPGGEVAKCSAAGRTQTMHILKGGLARHQDDLVTLLKLCQTQILSHISAH